MRDKPGVLEVSLEPVRLDQPTDVTEGILPEGAYQLLRVRDTGHGISEEALRKVFLPFFTTKEVGEGTGLGLSIVHGIVLGMGGGIQVDSVAGEGTTFSVYFPALGQEQPEPAQDRDPLPMGTERVLVLDDEESIGTMLKDVLTYLGYRAEAMESSVDVLERLRQDPLAFDLVLTDKTMPQLTGLELAAELARIRPGLPVILMTGISTAEEEAAARAAGVAALLHKPVAMPVLAKALRQALEAVHA
jgi:CheY-like chemotaxis protein